MPRAGWDGGRGPPVGLSPLLSSGHRNAQDTQGWVRRPPPARQPACPAPRPQPTARLENGPEFRAAPKPGTPPNEEVPTFRYQPMKCAGTKPSSLSCGAQRQASRSVHHRELGRGPAAARGIPACGRHGPWYPHPIQSRVTRVPEASMPGAAPSFPRGRWWGPHVMRPAVPLRAPTQTLWKGSVLLSAS